MKTKIKSLFYSKYLTISVGVILFLNLAISLYYFSKSEESNLNSEINKTFISVEAGYRLLNAKFYMPEKIKYQNMYDGILQGVSRVPKDRYTVFYPLIAADHINNQINGTSIGFGMIVEKISDGYRITYIYEDSSANKKGLLKGDIITKINGTNIGDQEVDWKKVFIASSGKKEFILEIQRNEKEVFDVILENTKIVSSDVKGAGFIGNNILYVSIGQFSANVYDDLFKVLLEKKEASNSLILDLRGNPGGILNSAVKIASLFLPVDSIIAEVISKNDIHKSYKATENKINWEKPIVILVDKNSASSSELLSGALQDYNKAVLLGTKTFGKAHVQEICPLPYGGNLNITTGIYITPRGRMIDSRGLNPDVLKEVPEEQQRKVAEKRKVPDFSPSELLMIDNQLEEAVNILSSSRYEEILANKHIIQKK